MAAARLVSLCCDKRPYYSSISAAQVVVVSLCEMPQRHYAQASSVAKATTAQVLHILRCVTYRTKERKRRS
jgi:hypothetical protein